MVLKSRRWGTPGRRGRGLRPRRGPARRRVRRAGQRARRRWPLGRRRRPARARRFRPRAALGHARPTSPICSRPSMRWRGARRPGSGTASAGAWRRLPPRRRPSAASGLVLLDPGSRCRPEASPAQRRNRTPRLELRHRRRGRQRPALQRSRWWRRRARSSRPTSADDVRKGPDGRFRFSFCPGAAVVAWSEMTLPAPPIAHAADPARARPRSR